jgi:flagellar biogenesis protein FliO
VDTQSVAQLDAGTSVLQMFTSLALCLAVFLVVVYFLKKFKVGTFQTPKGLIKIKDRTPLDASHQLFVVEVQGSSFLVATSSGGVSLEKIKEATSAEFEACLTDAQGKVA